MIKIYIDNTEIYCDKNFTIENEMLNIPNVILDNVYPASWEVDQDYVSRFYYPPDYAKVKIYDDENLIFCGVVKNTGTISLNPRNPHYCSIEVLDFKTFLSEGETLDFVIANKTIQEALEQVTSVIEKYGFTLGDVNILNPNEIIGAYSTKDKTAYDVYQYIADITNSRWTTKLIDENTVQVNFYDPTLMNEGLEIEYTEEFFEDNNIIDINFNYGTYDYRNKQVMLSSEVYSSISQQEVIVANGYQTQFNTEQKIGLVNSITVNGTERSFTTKDNKELGYTADFYYSPGENYFESNDLQSAGSIINISYQSVVEGRQVIINPNEINRINASTGRYGAIARYENRNDATTSGELQKIGESYIKFKGVPEILLNVSSTNDLWEVGETVSFTDAPLDELETSYMVKKKKINYIATQSTIFYSYELTSSYNSETQINYFDNQRNKANGNIGAGEYISRNYDIESTANVIFYDTSVEEITVVGDNVLNAPLNAPFVQ